MQSKRPERVESPVEEPRQDGQQQDGQRDVDADSPRDSLESKRKWKFNPVMVLENSGSVARDHLASERTFLAYVRTSLAIASVGVALVQLFTISAKAVSDSNQPGFAAATKRIHAWARPIGVVTVSLGIAVLLIGATRYFAVQSALVQGKFPVARFLIAGIAFALGILVTVVFGVLVSGVPRA